MYDSFKIYILLATFIHKLEASELESIDRPFWQLYNLTSIPETVITWVGERSGYSKPKSVIQRMAIKAVTENKKKQHQADSQLKLAKIQTSNSAKSLFDSLIVFLQDWEWTWNAFNLEESDEEYLEEGLTASSEGSLIFTETSKKKPTTSSTLPNTTKNEPGEAHHAFLYKNKGKKCRKSKAPKLTAQDTILSATLTKEPIDEHTSKALDASQSLEQAFCSTLIDGARITATQDPIDVIITDNLYHPTVERIASPSMKNIDGHQSFTKPNSDPTTDNFVLSIHSLEKLEKELSPFFAEIANTRNRYTATCEELIEKVGCLLIGIDISLRDELFLEKIKALERQKADLKTKRYDFEQYIKKVLDLQQHTNQEKPSDYFYTTMENIYLYNLYLLEKINNFENILHVMDAYL